MSTSVGTTQQSANALAIWHGSLSVAQQKKLNTDLLTKAQPVYGRDLRKNFRDGLKDPNVLHVDTIDFVLAYAVVLFARTITDAFTRTESVVLPPLSLAA